MKDKDFSTVFPVADFDRITAERDAALGREASHLAVLERVDKFGCTTCDGSGHLHRIDGEYMGHCESCLAYEHERLTRERDALQQRLTETDEENDALKHWRDLALQFDSHRMKALWHLRTLVSDGAHYDAAAAFLSEPPIQASELQQRADDLQTQLEALEQRRRAEFEAGQAAERRVEVLEGLLRRVVASSVLSFERDAPEELEGLEVDICAALKPTAEGASHE